MSTKSDAVTAQSVPMSNETRGKALRERRIARGIKSVRKFAEVTGVSRDAVTAAEEGTASAGTYERLEAWLDSFDEETGHDVAEPPGPVRFRLSGNFGVEVVVEGPVENIAELEASVARLIQRMGEAQQSQNGDSQ